MHGRLAGLDLIRGIAIGLVLLRHAWPEIVGSGGIVGVVAFFALSGYLITGILMKDVRSRGRVRYGRFYRNRALRLFPPLLFMLAGFVVVTLTLNPLDDRDGIVRAIFTAVTYTGNLPYDHGSAAVDHLWTLATEEQFYLVWPLILTFAFRRKSMGRAFGISTVLLATAVVASILLTAPNIHRIYTLPTSWAIAMIIGAAAKVWEHQVRGTMPTWFTPRAGGSAAALILVALSFIPDPKNSPFGYLLLGPVVAVVTVALMMAWSSWRDLPSPVLRPLLALGTISYAAYLWNYPIVLWLGDRPLSPIAAIGSIVLTIVAATASWWLVERPVQALRKRLDRPARPASPPVEQPASDMR